MSNPQLILASTSPRRIELLTQAGLNPLVIAPHADETIISKESPRSMVARLAREKAEAVAIQVLTGCAVTSIIIAADTTVVAPNGKTILGKPVNEADARRMLAKLAGNTHTVLTGYCILKLSPISKTKKSPAFQSHVLVRVVRSRVKMRTLSRADIARYVATGEPMDKAGSYAAQGIGMALIDSISGSYSNVVGLPICQLLADLEERFGIAWLKKGK